MPMAATFQLQPFLQSNFGSEFPNAFPRRFFLRHCVPSKQTFSSDTSFASSVSTRGRPYQRVMSYSRLETRTQEGCEMQPRILDYMQKAEHRSQRDITIRDSSGLPHPG